MSYSNPNFDPATLQPRVTVPQLKVPPKPEKPLFWDRKLRDAKPLDVFKGNTMRNAYWRWYANYGARYHGMNGRGSYGSLKPIMHLMIGTMILNYAWEWGSMHKYHQKRRWH